MTLNQMQPTCHGRSRLKVSEFALGTMTFGREADEAASHRMLDLFVERGGNFIDIADARWLAGRDRDEMVLANNDDFIVGAQAGR